MSVTGTVVLIAVLLPAAAWGQAPASGDVYAVNGLGQTLRAAGIQVSALRRTPQSAAALDSTCVIYQRQNDPNLRLLAYDKMLGIPPELPEAASPRAQRVEALAQEWSDSVAKFVIDTTRTNVDGHYRFPELPPGEYWIIARGRLADGFYEWSKAIVLTSAPRSVDLDPSVMIPTLLCKPNR